MNKLPDQLYWFFFSTFRKKSRDSSRESDEETDESFRFVCAESLTPITLVCKSFIHLWNNPTKFHYTVSKKTHGVEQSYMSAHKGSIKLYYRVWKLLTWYFSRVLYSPMFVIHGRSGKWHCAVSPNVSLSSQRAHRRCRELTLQTQPELGSGLMTKLLEKKKNNNDFHLQAISSLLHLQYITFSSSKDGRQRGDDILILIWTHYCESI